ncbi:MAG: hypothetical protein RL456_1604 [Pseudomonadota bacterium]
MNTPIQDSSAPTGDADPGLLLQMHQFHEESAQQYKSDAWTQATWLLTLSGAVLGFSIDKHVSQRGAAEAVIITLACAAAGLLLAGYAWWVLNDLADHAQNHWTKANNLVASSPNLMQYIALAGQTPVATGTVGKPKAIARLLWIVMAFSQGHVVWAVYAFTSSKEGGPAAQVRCQPPPSAQPPCPSAPTQTPALPARSDHTPPSSSRSAAADRASG